MVERCTYPTPCEDGFDCKDGIDCDRTSILIFHREEQFDLKCKPIICINRKTANSSTRIFCLWFWGIEIGNFKKGS